MEKRTDLRGLIEETPSDAPEPKHTTKRKKHHKVSMTFERFDQTEREKGKR